jgi:BMFP domain-containing protein YqiC
VLNERFGSVDDWVHPLLAGVPEALGGMRRELEAHFRVVMRSQLAKLDLTTREEFAVQTKVLERTRMRVEQLESRLVALEQQNKQKPAAK